MGEAAEDAGLGVARGQLDSAVKVGERRAELSKLGVGLAPIDEGADRLGPQLQRLVEIGDGGAIVALSRGQDDAAVDDRQDVVRLEPQRLIIVALGTIALAQGMKRHAAAEEGGGVRPGRIHRDLGEADRLAIVDDRPRRVAHRDIGRTAVETGQRQLTALQPARFDGDRAGGLPLLGVGAGVVEAVLRLGSGDLHKLLGRRG